MTTLNKSDAWLQLKSVDEDGEGTIEGMGSVFGNEDSYGDVIDKGAFAETLASGRSIAMLYQHDVRDPIGVWDELEETDEGLRVKGRIATDVTRGRDALGLARLGAIKGLSIGFRIPAKGAYWDEDNDVRRLVNIDLHEVSMVTFPANDKALVTGVKALIEDGELSTISDLERHLRDVGGFSRQNAKAFLSLASTLLRQRDAGDLRKQIIDDEAAAKIAKASASISEILKKKGSSK